MERGSSNLLSGLVGAIIGATIAFFCTYINLYVQYEIDKVKNVENAYHQINIIQYIINNQKREVTEIPVAKLLYYGINWNIVFSYIHDEKCWVIYYELCFFDDLRDKIFSTSDEKAKRILISEYWNLFYKITEGDEIKFLHDKIYEIRLSAQENVA